MIDIPNDDSLSVQVAAYEPHILTACLTILKQEVSVQDKAGVSHAMAMLVHLKLVDLLFSMLVARHSMRDPIDRVGITRGSDTDFLSISDIDDIQPAK